MVHRHVVSTSSHEQPRVRLTSVCISTTISMLYFMVAGLKGEALFHGLRGHLTWIPFIISMGISKFTCVWDPSRNSHGFSYQTCSCLWYYWKHIRDICQGAAESCTSMSFLHWGWWPSIWATVVRCKMYVNCVNVLYLHVTVTNVNKKVDGNVIDKFTVISPFHGPQVPYLKLFSGASAMSCLIFARSYWITPYTGWRNMSALINNSNGL